MTKIKLNAAARLGTIEINAAWGSNRLALALKGDAEALEDVPKIIDDATRNVTNLLDSYKSKIKSLQRMKDSTQLKATLKELQKLVRSIEE